MLYYCLMEQLDIKIIRRKLKLTQKEYAEKIGVDFCTVNRWERGHCKPSQLALKEISNLFKKYKTEKEG